MINGAVKLRDTSTQWDVTLCFGQRREFHTVRLCDPALSAGRLGYGLDSPALPAAALADGNPVCRRIMPASSMSCTMPSGRTASQRHDHDAVGAGTRRSEALTECSPG